MPAHAAMPWGWLSPRGRVLSGAGLGVLGWAVRPGLVDEAVGDGLAWEMRLRALPARLVVYFVLGLCLFSGEAYGQVLRQLAGGLEAALAAAGWAWPSSTALSAARRRIGEKPLEGVFRRLAGPLSPGRAPWSHVCGLLAVAWDGTTVAAQPSPANDAALGRPGGPGHRARSAAPAQGGGGAYPQLRLVTLAACGTRALLNAAFGPSRGKGTGERELARQLLGSLRAGMLLIADRGFYSWALWNAAAATGAHLLWRAPASMHLPVARELPDGSWLARIPDPAAARARSSKNFKAARRGSPPDTSPLPAITVRVIAYAITVTADDGTARTERYRLITTLLDWRACPAGDLAAGYCRRWAIETAYLELKAFLRGPGRLLRARAPGPARQELWAYLAIYQAIRALICRAAARSGTDPGRLSFTTALHAVRRDITARGNLDAALAAAEDEILASPVPLRDYRIYPRAVRRPLSPYPSRRARPGPISQHATYTVTLTTPPAPARTTPSQHKQQEPPPANPP